MGWGGCAAAAAAAAAAPPRRLRKMAGLLRRRGWCMAGTAHHQGSRLAQLTARPGRRPNVVVAHTVVAAVGVARTEVVARRCMQSRQLSLLSAAIGSQWVLPPRHGDPIINHLSSCPAGPRSSARCGLARSGRRHAPTGGGAGHTPPCLPPPPSARKSSGWGRSCCPGVCILKVA
jgi:hypothetical protein